MGSSGKEEQFAYKRALSRLLEMTSARYTEEEQWRPLSLDERKWEGPTRHPEGYLERYSGTKRSEELFVEDVIGAIVGEKTKSSRPMPPKIRSSHIWGLD